MLWWRICWRSVQASNYNRLRILSEQYLVPPQYLSPPAHSTTTIVHSAFMTCRPCEKGLLLEQDGIGARYGTAIVLYERLELPPFGGTGNREIVPNDHRYIPCTTAELELGPCKALRALTSRTRVDPRHPLACSTSPIRDAPW